MRDYQECQTKEDWLQWVSENRALFEVSSPQYADKAVFHSGGLVNPDDRRSSSQLMAETSCGLNGNITLKNTKGGAILERGDLFTSLGREAAKEIWAAASQVYAASVQGKVWAFSQLARETDIFLGTEIPTLLSNEKVTHINEVPVEKLQTISASGHSKALQEVNREISSGVKEITWEPQERNAAIAKEPQEEFQIEIEGDIQENELDDLLSNSQVAEAMAELRPGEAVEIEIEERVEVQTQSEKQVQQQQQSSQQQNQSRSQ